MLFDPSEKVSRLEFLVCAMDAFGAGNIPSSSDAGFADTDTIPEKHRGYVSAAKSLGIVSGVNEGGRMYFRGDEEITTLRRQSSSTGSSDLKATAQNH